MSDKKTLIYCIKLKLFIYLYILTKTKKTMFYIIFFTFLFYMYIDAYKNEMTHDNKKNKINCWECGHEQTPNEEFNFCTKCLTHL